MSTKYEVLRTDRITNLRSLVEDSVKNEYFCTSSFFVSQIVKDNFVVK